MTREDFKNALRESAALRNNDILNDTSEYTFSDTFEKRMHKLIKSVDSYGIKSPKRYYKWAAIVAASLVLLFTTSTMHVSSTPEDVARMKVTKYPTYYEITFEDYLTSHIANKYEPSYIPEGYEPANIEDIPILTSYQSSILNRTILNDFNVLYTYMNSDGQIITFRQYITYNDYHRFPTENVTFQKLDTQKVDATLYNVDGTTMVIWMQNNYFMKLTTTDTLSEAEIIKIVESVTFAH